MPRSIKSNKKSTRIEWQKAPDVQKEIEKIVSTLNLDWLDANKILAYRSAHSTSNAYARIWSMPKVWQLALNIKPHYVIEVLSEKFDKLPLKEQNKVLLHEIAHIPKNFSGSLLPHVRKRGKRNFHDRVEKLVNAYAKAVRNNKLSD